MKGTWVLFSAMFVICCGSSINDYGNISCKDRLHDLAGDTYTSELLFRLKCPLDCQTKHYWVYGSGPYFWKSSICRAAIHSGNFGDGHIIIKTISGRQDAFYVVTTRNNIQSHKASWAGHESGFYVLEAKTSAIVSSSNNTTSTETGSAIKMIPASPTTDSSLGDTVITSLQDTKSATPSPTTRTTFLNVTAQKASKSTTMKRTQPPKTTRAVTTGSLVQNPSTSANIVMTTLEKIKDSDKLIQAAEPTISDVNITDVTSRLSMTSQSLNNEHFSEKIFENTVEKILLGLVFVAGFLVAAMILLLRRWKKKKLFKWRRQYSRRNTNSQNDEEMCVCYQTLDASSQGLLYDPETCHRPCSKKQEENLQLQIRSSDTKSSEKNKICYENDCSEKCVGTCNPEMFEF